jgi:hypothetical protein
MSYPPATVVGVDAIGGLIGTFVVELPILIALIAGLVVLSSAGRRLPGRSAPLARAGLVVLLVQTVLSLLWAGLLPQLLVRTHFGDGSVSIRSYGLISGVVAFLLALVFAVGLTLLVAALLAARQPASPPAYGPGYPVTADSPER